jgi:hypothetical protein
MYYLIYSSLTKKDLSRDELFQILEKSRSRNNLMGLSGFLLCINEDYFSEIINGIFLQVLEGEKEDVLKLSDIIKKDKRHHDLVLVTEGVSLKRMFDNWKMGYRDMNILQFKSRLAQFDLKREDILKPAENPEDSQAIIELIKSFYKVPDKLLK